MNVNDSPRPVDMSPAAISRRIRKAYDLGMLHRHFLSKFATVLEMPGSEKEVTAEQKGPMPADSKDTHGSR